MRFFRVFLTNAEWEGMLALTSLVCSLRADAVKHRAVDLSCPGSSLSVCAMCATVGALCLRCVDSIPLVSCRIRASRTWWSLFQEVSPPLRPVSIPSGDCLEEKGSMDAESRLGKISRRLRSGVVRPRTTARSVDEVTFRALDLSCTLRPILARTLNSKISDCSSGTAAAFLIESLDERLHATVSCMVSSIRD
jgi:hypothetical protein